MTTSTDETVSEDQSAEKSGSFVYESDSDMDDCLSEMPDPSTVEDESAVAISSVVERSDTLQDRTPFPSEVEQGDAEATFKEMRSVLPAAEQNQLLALALERDAPGSCTVSKPNTVDWAPLHDAAWQDDPRYWRNILLDHNNPHNKETNSLTCNVNDYRGSDGKKQLGDRLYFIEDVEAAKRTRSKYIPTASILGPAGVVAWSKWEETNCVESKAAAFDANPRNAASLLRNPQAAKRKCSFKGAPCIPSAADKNDPMGRCPVWVEYIAFKQSLRLWKICWYLYQYLTTNVDYARLQGKVMTVKKNNSNWKNMTLLEKAEAMETEFQPIVPGTPIEDSEGNKVPGQFVPCTEVHYLENKATMPLKPEERNTYLSDKEAITNNLALILCSKTDTKKARKIVNAEFVPFATASNPDPQPIPADERTLDRGDIVAVWEQHTGYPYANKYHCGWKHSAERVIKYYSSHQKSWMKPRRTIGKKSKKPALIPDEYLKHSTVHDGRRQKVPEKDQPLVMPFNQIFNNYWANKDKIQTKQT